RSYPSAPAEAGLQLFLGWFGAHYARSASPSGVDFEDGEILSAGITVGRRWQAGVTVLDTLTPVSDLEFEAGRAALEQRLDDAGHRVALWVPRGAAVPAQEPGLSDIAAAIDEAVMLPDGRLELRR